MSKELEALELFQELKYEYLRTIKDNKLDLIENALKENEALKSQVVGLENAYDKLADKFERYYKALEIILSKNQLNIRSIFLTKDYHYYKQFNLFFFIKNVAIICLE